MPPGCLTGLRVVDLTRVYAGPLCTQVLADNGADVIKVEPPQGDETREWGVVGEDGHSSYFWGLNRNKRAIALDLSDPDGRKVLHALLRDADVLVDNFKTGTLEAWGLGREDLRARWPRLVHLSISGFGRCGPLAGYPGYDAAVQAFAGVMSVNGESGGHPLKLPVPMVDMATGLYAVSAIAMALLERQRSGLGQHIDLSLYDVALTVTHPLSTTWMFDQKVPRPSGNVYAAIAPYGIYACRDGRIFTGAGNNRAFGKLCIALGMRDLPGDPRFSDNQARVQHRVALDDLIGQACATQDAEPLALLLMRQGVSAGVLHDIGDAFDHPHTRSSGMVWQGAAHPLVGSPIRFGRTPAALRRPPPRFAQDTTEVLAELGLAPQSEADSEHTEREE